MPNIYAAVTIVIYTVPRIMMGNNNSGGRERWMDFQCPTSKIGLIMLDKNGALQIRAKTNTSQTPVDFHQN